MHVQLGIASVMSAGTAHLFLSKVASQQGTSARNLLICTLLLSCLLILAILATATPTVLGVNDARCPHMRSRSSPAPPTEHRPTGDSAELRAKS